MHKISAAIIGAGRIGSFLASLFKAHKIGTEIIIDRNIQKARCIGEKYRIKYISDDILTIPNKVNLFCICVEDRFITDVARKITELRKNFNGSYCFHTSGSLSSSKLEELKAKGCEVFSFHPNISFVSDEVNYNVSEIVWAIESNSQKAIRFANKLVRRFNGNSVVLLEQEKEIYHAISVLLSNYSTILFQIIQKSFSGSINLTKSYYGLLKSTLINIEKLGTDMALTGPLIRNDVETIQKNLMALKKSEPKLAKIYVELGQLALENLIQNKKVEYNSIEPILRVFKEEV